MQARLLNELARAALRRRLALELGRMCMPLQAGQLPGRTTRPYKADPRIARRPTATWRDEAGIRKSSRNIDDNADVASAFNRGNIVRLPQHGINFKEQRIFHGTLAEP